MPDYRCAVCGARAVVVRGAEGSRKWLCWAHAGDAPDDWPVLAYQRDESDERDERDWDALIAEVAPPRTDGVLPVRGTAEWSAFMRALNGRGAKPEEPEEGGPGAD